MEKIMASAIEDTSSIDAINQQNLMQEIDDQNNSITEATSSGWYGATASVMAVAGSLGADMMQALNQANNEQHLKDLVSAATNRNGIGLDSKIESSKVLNDRFKLNMDSQINQLVNDKKTYEDSIKTYQKEANKAGVSAKDQQIAMMSMAASAGVALAVPVLGAVAAIGSAIATAIFGSSKSKHMKKANQAQDAANKASNAMNSVQNKMKEKLDNDGSKQETTKGHIDAQQNNIKNLGSFFGSL